MSDIQQLLSNIQDGLSDIDRGIETMHTFTESALFLYHSKQDFCAAKNRLSKGLRKATASLLQGSYKIKHNTDMLRNSISFTNTSFDVTCLPTHVEATSPPLDYFDGTDNVEDEKFLLEASLNVEKAEAAAEVPCAFVHSQCQEVKQGSKEATLKSKNSSVIASQKKRKGKMISSKSKTSLPTNTISSCSNKRILPESLMKPKATPKSDKGTKKTRSQKQLHGQIHANDGYFLQQPDITFQHLDPSSPQKETQNVQ